MTFIQPYICQSAYFRYIFCLREDRYSSRHVDRQFHILFMPKNSEACCRKLKELNVFGSFTHIESFGANLLPLDTDLLTLNNPRCVKVRTPAADAHLCCGCLCRDDSVLECEAFSAL